MKDLGWGLKRKLSTNRQSSGSAKTCCWILIFLFQKLLSTGVGLTPLTPALWKQRQADPCWVQSRPGQHAFQDSQSCISCLRTQHILPNAVLSNWCILYNCIQCCVLKAALSRKHVRGYNFFSLVVYFSPWTNLLAQFGFISPIIKDL